MKIIAASVVNGSLIFATSAGLLALPAGALIQAWMIAAYVPSFIMAVACTFLATGGLEAFHARQRGEVSFCAMLAIGWTMALCAAAVFLISALLPSGWISADAGKSLLLAGTIAHAALLLSMARHGSFFAGRNLNL